MIDRLQLARLTERVRDIAKRVKTEASCVEDEDAEIWESKELKECVK